MPRVKLKPMEERIVDLSVDCKEILDSSFMKEAHKERSLNTLGNKYKVEMTTVKNVCSYLIANAHLTEVPMKIAILYKKWNRRRALSITTGLLGIITSLEEW